MSLIKRGRDNQGRTGTEGQPCEEATKRWPSASQGEKPQEKPNLPTPYLRLPAYRTMRKSISAFLSTQSVVFDYGSPSKLTYHLYFTRLSTHEISPQKNTYNRNLENMS